MYFITNLMLKWYCLDLINDLAPVRMFLAQVMQMKTDVLLLSLHPEAKLGLALIVFNDPIYQNCRKENMDLQKRN